MVSGAAARVSVADLGAGRHAIGGLDCGGGGGRSQAEPGAAPCERSPIMIPCLKRQGGQNGRKGAWWEARDPRRGADNPQSRVQSRIVFDVSGLVSAAMRADNISPDLALRPAWTGPYPVTGTCPGYAHGAAF